MTPSSIGYSLRSVQAHLRSGLGLPFAELLPADQIEMTLETHEITYRQRLFTPVVTLWAFLSQVLDKNKACTDAVSRIVSVMVAHGQAPLPPMPVPIAKPAIGYLRR